MSVCGEGPTPGRGTLLDPLGASWSMDEFNVCQSILIGIAGGAGAGVAVWCVRLLHEWGFEQRDKRRVHNWLKDNTKNQEGCRFRSTRAIASWTNLTESRVRYICSIHNKIFLSTGHREDLWSLYEVHARDTG